MKIKFSPPDITQQEIDEVVDTLRSGWITTGPKTKRLEENLAEFIGTNRVACLNSATFAMEMVLRYLGIGPGDEVITCAYTYTASASVVHHVGAKLVLVDCLKDKPFMDYDKIAQAITPKTKAIIPIHLGGIMMDLKPLKAILEANKHLFSPANDRQAIYGRPVILADGAHSLGARRDSLNCGQDADFTCYSFHAVKNFTTAEGGGLTWQSLPGRSDEEVYKEFMLLSLHGQNKDALQKSKAGAWEYDIIFPGYKGNMTDIMASLGLVQLTRLPELLARRKEIIAAYDSYFKGDDRFRVLDHREPGQTSTGHLYILGLKGLQEEGRNEVIRAMDEAGIATNVHYKPLPLLTAYKKMGFDIKDYPNAYDYYHNAITLPLHTLLTDEEVAYVAQTLIAAYEAQRGEA